MVTRAARRNLSWAAFYSSGGSSVRGTSRSTSTSIPSGRSSGWIGTRTPFTTRARTLIREKDRGAPAEEERGLAEGAEARVGTSGVAAAADVAGAPIPALLGGSLAAER